ncbi:MAG: DUF4115 domain-containing protein [Actinomycetota bacterium]|nr:DUF4115 domain-containing protein [Actinomycetota bacterium]
MTTSSVDLSLSAANRCWVELRSVSASGPLVYAGVLSAGSVRSFAAPGLWLRLGFPEAVRIQVDGRPITLPASADPYDVTVQSTPA